MLRMFHRHTTILGLLVFGGLGSGGAGSPQQQSDFGSAPEFWLLLLLIVIFLAILAWWALSRRPAANAEPSASHATPARTPAPATPAKSTAVTAAPVEAAPVETAPVETAAEEAAEEEAEAEETALPTPEDSEVDLAAPPATPPAEPPGPAPEETEEEPAPLDEAAAAPGVLPGSGGPDDLRRIEGIGPKVEGALHGLGITTYVQLAEADPAELEEKIRASGVRVLPGAPKTWPEQAALAARGDWEGFEKLTGELKGGRRSK